MSGSVYDEETAKNLSDTRLVSPRPAPSDISSSTKAPIVVTTKKEIWSWWLYMAAIEPISVAVLMLFLPLLLEALPTILKVPSERLIEWGSVVISGQAFSYGIITISAALQAVMFICFGALVDYGNNRKKLLVASTTCGSLLCVAILLARGSASAIVVGVLNILITMAFGASLMLYNSYLPLLALNHPKTLELQKGQEDPVKVQQARQVVSSKLSTKSFMLGYSSAVLVLIAGAAYVKVMTAVTSKDTATVFSSMFLHLEIVIAACGVIWGLGSIWPLLGLLPRAGPSLPPGSSVWTFSLLKTVDTLKRARKLPHTFRFLGAFFLFADGSNAIGQFAVLFARNVLKVTIDTLIYCAILAPCCGVMGNYFFYFIQKKLNLSTKTMLLIILGLILALVGYGCIGVFTTVVGLHHEWETYMFAGSYGFLIGAMHSFSRVIFGELIPPSEEGEFFALYSITDKGSSWIGLASQTLVASYLPHQQRYGLFILGTFILLPIPLLIWGIDLVQGKQDASKASMAAE